MLRAFSSDNHDHTLGVTRALSLSDCFWLKLAHEEVSFEEITPYFAATPLQGGFSPLSNPLKDCPKSGSCPDFGGASLATLFVNGAANKRWINSHTLLKVGSYKEYAPYELCTALGLQHISQASLAPEGLVLTNFTSTEVFLESMAQSGVVSADEHSREVAVSLFGELAVALFVIDYLVEHDDRHSGNYGFLRSTSTGEYLSMAPFYDFDWAWSGAIVDLPKLAWEKHGSYICNLCHRALTDARHIDYYDIISKRANELLHTCPGSEE